MLRYPVVLTPDDNGTLLVTSPDFPELASFGENEADALGHAVDAIETAIQGRITDREPIPEPSAGHALTVALPALTAAKVALYRAMQAEGVGKAELARRLGCHAPQIDRLLDLGHASRLDQIEAALHALGRELHIETRPAA